MNTRRILASIAVLLACLGRGICSPLAGVDSLHAVSDTVSTHPPLPEAKVISETPIPSPTAAFRMDSGRVFTFATIEDTLAKETNPTFRAAQLSVGLGAFPIGQRITCLGSGRSGDTGAIALWCFAKAKNPRAATKNKETVLYLLTSSMAQIDVASGQIHREIRSPIGGTVGADTLKEEYWDFTRTLWDFYGRWMLHLSDTFRYERTVSNPMAGITTTTLEVLGRDTVETHPCWIVRSRTGAPGRPGLAKTYWVDIVDRVAVQVRQEQLVLKRIGSDRASPSEKK